MFYFTGNCCCLTVGKQCVRDEQSVVYTAGPRGATGSLPTEQPAEHGHVSPWHVLAEVRVWEGVCRAPHRHRGSLLLSNTLRIPSAARERPSWTSKLASLTSEPERRLPAARPTGESAEDAQRSGPREPQTRPVRSVVGTEVRERISISNPHFMPSHIVSQDLYYVQGPLHEECIFRNSAMSHFFLPPHFYDDVRIRLGWKLAFMTWFFFLLRDTQNVLIRSKIVFFSVFQIWEWSVE